MLFSSYYICFLEITKNKYTNFYLFILLLFSNNAIIFDPSHSSGNSKYIIPISNAALQLGASGLIIETHTVPQNSKVDSLQAISR